VIIIINYFVYLLEYF